MSMPVGCLTQVHSVIVTGGGKRVRHTIEQDWFLHPTKGWKRGPRRKKTEPIKLGGKWEPKFSFRELWKKWR